MPDPIAIVNEAAKHDDRWLFIALLTIGLLAVWMIVKYFMAQIGVLSQRIDAIHTEYQGYLRDQNDRLSKIIAENTAVLRLVEKNIPRPA